MAYRITYFENKKAPPTTKVVAGFSQFKELVPNNALVSTKSGLKKKKKFVKDSNFTEFAEEVNEPPQAQPEQALQEPKTLHPAKEEVKATPPSTKMPNSMMLPNPAKPSVSQPMIDLNQFCNVLAKAMAQSVEETMKTMTEGWKVSLRSTIEEANKHLRENLESLSMSYLDVGEKVGKALESGALDEVAKKQFKDLEQSLVAANEKVLEGLRSEKSGVDAIRQEINKSLQNLGTLAAVVEEDARDVSRKVGKFKLGTAEILEQQVKWLQQQLAEEQAKCSKLREDMLRYQCAHTESDPAFVEDLKTRVAEIPSIKGELQKKELELQEAHELLKVLEAKTKKSQESFSKQNRLQELEALAKHFEESQKDLEDKLEDAKRDAHQSQFKLKEVRKECQLLKEHARSTKDLEEQLRSAKSIAEARDQECEAIARERDDLLERLAKCQLALEQEEQYYRSTALEADRKAMLEEFRKNQDRLETERQRLNELLSFSDQSREKLESENLRLRDEVETLKADKLEIQSQIDTGLPEAFERAKKEIRSLREDEVRFAQLTASCAKLEELESNLKESVANQLSENGRLREELAELQWRIGELRAEKESFESLKRQRESDRLQILQEIESDPIAQEFSSKDDFTELKWLESVRDGIQKAGFKISDRLLYSFHTALKCQDISPITLLMGISGTGKSELPRLYSELGGIHFHLSAVQPNWDSPSDLFGFYNYAEARPKLEPLSRFLLQFLPTLGNGAEAKPKRGDELLLVLLDEMNLARVEYYFSDLLSRLEARRSRLGQRISKATHEQASISLDMGAAGARSLFLDTNVLFVGTLNQDESTLDVSDKVIDRANAITFPRPRSFSPVSAHQGIGDPVDWRLSRRCWDQWCRGSGTATDEDLKLQETFKQINTSLRYVERGVAHRVFQAVQRYIAAYPEFAAKGASEARKMALVDQFVMKILPKLKGVPTDTQDGKACLEGILSVLPDDLKEDYSYARRGEYFEWQGSEKLFETGS